jgi:hypothetical protein
MTRSSRRSPSQEAARGFWIRAWSQREPTKQGTSRLSSPARGARLRKGGLDIPATHVPLNLVCIEHPLRTLTRCAWSRATRVGTLRLVQLISPCPKGAVRGSSAHRTKPQPQCRSQREGSAALEAANSCSTRTVRRRDGWRPIQTTSGPLLLNG